MESARCKAFLESVERGSFRPAGEVTKYDKEETAAMLESRQFLFLIII